MRKRLLTILLASLLGALVATGCGDKAGEDASTESSAENASEESEGDLPEDGQDAEENESDPEESNVPVESENLTLRGNFYGDAPVEEWMPAYQKEIGKLITANEDVWKKAVYGLVYIDSDTIPELICKDPTGAEQTVVYTYHTPTGISKAKAPALEGLTGDVEKQELHIAYREKENQLAFLAYSYAAPVGKGPKVTSKDVLYQIRNGAFEKLDKGTHTMDMNADAKNRETFKYGSDQEKRKDYDRHFDPEGAYTWLTGYTYNNILNLLSPGNAEIDDEEEYPFVYNDFVEKQDAKGKADGYALIQVDPADVPLLVVGNSKKQTATLYSCQNGELVQIEKTSQKKGHEADGYYKKGNVITINEAAGGDGFTKYARLNNGQMEMTGYYEWYQGENGPELDFVNDRYTRDADASYASLEKGFTGDFQPFADINLLSRAAFMGEEDKAANASAQASLVTTQGDGTGGDITQNAANGVTNGFGTNEDNADLAQYNDNGYAFEGSDLILFEDPQSVTIKIKNYPQYDYTAAYTYYELEVENHTDREIMLDNISANGEVMPIEYNMVPSDRQIQASVAPKGVTDIHFAIEKAEVDQLGLGYLTDVSIPFCIYHPLEDDYVKVLKQINLNYSTDLIPGDAVSASGSGSKSSGSQGSSSKSAGSKTSGSGTGNKSSGTNSKSGTSGNNQAALSSTQTSGTVSGGTVSAQGSQQNNAPAARTASGNSVTNNAATGSAQ